MSSNSAAGQAASMTAGPQRTAIRSRLSRGALASAAIYLLFCALVLVNALARPVSNWDMLAYVGAVVRHQGETRAPAIHAKAYDSVRRAVQPEEMRELLEAGHYRRVQARDADAFVSMLPMYEVKGGYVTLVSALSAVADPVRVMRGLSLAATLGLLAALAAVFWRIGALHLLGLTVPVLAALRVNDLASLCAPDALVAMLGVGAAGLILVRGVLLGALRPPAAALAMLVAAVALRPDMLVATTGLPFALVGGSALAARLAGARPLAALADAVRAVGSAPWLAAVAGFAAYVAAKWGVAHPGWWAHFNFSFIEQQDTMAGFAPAFDLRLYASALARVAVRMLREETWPWLVMALALAGLLAVRLREAPAALLALAIFVGGILAARMIAFPLPDARVATPLVLTLLMMAAAWAVSFALPSPARRAS